MSFKPCPSLSEPVRNTRSSEQLGVRLLRPDHPIAAVPTAAIPEVRQHEEGEVGHGEDEQLAGFVFPQLHAEKVSARSDTHSEQDGSRSSPLGWCTRRFLVRGLGADRAGDGQGVLLVVDDGRGEGSVALFEELEAEVAALFDPLVVLLGQDCADEPDDGVAVGEDRRPASDRAAAPSPPATARASAARFGDTDRVLRGRFWAVVDP